jgi:hypothetical protein
VANFLITFFRFFSLKLKTGIHEILQLNNNFVDDIVDHTYFTERKGQKILKNTNTNLKNILEDLFGKDAIPKIGKRYKKRLDINVQELN